MITTHFVLLVLGAYNTAVKAQDLLRVYLVDGPDVLHGRVVLEYNGVNGTVCDDAFDKSDARVICRMLGYLEINVYAVGTLYGGGVQGAPIWLDDVECSGTETDISQCSHRGWGRHNCTHEQDVSVLCGPIVDASAELGVYLIGGPDVLHGRLIVQYDGENGTVCGEDLETKDARVICRMLGYRGSHVSVSRVYGPGTGKIGFGGLYCHGYESNIGDCFYPQWGKHSCNHTTDVSVHCGQIEEPTPPPLLPTTAVLTPTTTSDISPTLMLEQSGRVALVLNGVTGYICSDGFDVHEATVFCRTFSLPDRVVEVRTFPPDPDDVIWLTNARCTGNESSISDCGFDIHGPGRPCNSGTNIGIFCSSHTDSLRVYLVDGPDVLHGRVVLEYNGINGTVCDDAFDKSDARVICRMLGYLYVGDIKIKIHRHDVH